MILFDAIYIIFTNEPIRTIDWYHACTKLTSTWQQNANNEMIQMQWQIMTSLCATVINISIYYVSDARQPRRLIVKQCRIDSCCQRLTATQAYAVQPSDTWCHIWKCWCHMLFMWKYAKFLLDHLAFTWTTLKPRAKHRLHHIAKKNVSQKSCHGFGESGSVSYRVYNLSSRSVKKICMLTKFSKIILAYKIYSFCFW